jgi:hypothetical protein
LQHILLQVKALQLKVARFYHACLTLGAAFSLDEVELTAQWVDAATQVVPVCLEEFVSGAA